MYIIKSMSYKVVYNACHGGFGMSKEGLDAYHQLSSEHVTHAECIERDDPILIHLVETMVHTIHDENSRLKIKEFPMKYKSFLQWHDYDGLESIAVDYDEYLIYHIQHVIHTQLSSDEKVARIQELYTEYDSRPKSIYTKNRETSFQTESAF